MSEDRGTYDHIGPDEPAGGVRPIGEILRQVMDERGWPLPTAHQGANGEGPDDVEVSR